MRFYPARALGIAAGESDPPVKQNAFLSRGHPPHHSLLLCNYLNNLPPRFHHLSTVLSLRPAVVATDSSGSICNDLTPFASCKRITRTENVSPADLIIARRYLIICN